MSITPPESPQRTPHPAGVAAWRVLFRMLAGFFMLFAFAFWSAAGWNCGWTQTVRIPIKTTATMSGTEAAILKDHFMPGLELLAIALLLSLVLFVVTFIRTPSR